MEMDKRLFSLTQMRGKALIISSGVKMLISPRPKLMVSSEVPNIFFLSVRTQLVINVPTH